MCKSGRAHAASIVSPGGAITGTAHTHGSWQEHSASHQSRLSASVDQWIGRSAPNPNPGGGECGECGECGEKREKRGEHEREQGIAGGRAGRAERGVGACGRGAEHGRRAGAGGAVRGRASGRAGHGRRGDEGRSGRAFSPVAIKRKCGSVDWQIGPGVISSSPAVCAARGRTARASERTHSQNCV